MENRMPGLLEGKVAIVTGAGRGIGRGIAVEFAREGARVAVASRSLPSIEETLAEIRALGGEAIRFRCDVGDPAAVVRTTAETADVFGRIDILVNNAQSFGSADEPAPTPVLTPLEI